MKSCWADYSRDVAILKKNVQEKGDDIGSDNYDSDENYNDR